MQFAKLSLPTYYLVLSTGIVFVVCVIRLLIARSLAKKRRAAAAAKRTN